MNSSLFKKNIFLIIFFSLATAVLVFWLYNKYVLTKLNGDTIRKVDTTSNTLPQITGGTDYKKFDYSERQTLLR